MANPQPPSQPLESPPRKKPAIPGLTINTAADPATPTPPATGGGSTPPSASSPPRPPISPITPMFGPSDGPSLPGRPGPRQTYAHAQPNQVGVAPPAPRPILFEENPDALALRSAIAVLQMQKRRAEGDIVALQRAKEAAVGDAGGFARDLAEGRIRSGGGGGVGSSAAGGDVGGGGGGAGGAWGELPARQEVVRCPPINWAKYAVVGESLDKLHAEQRGSPSLGAPAAVGPGGAYEFRGGEGERRDLVGVAAQYTPGRDKLVDKKSKAPRR